MINFNRLMITSGIISLVSVLGISHKAVAQISNAGGNTNDTVTFTSTTNIPEVCQFNNGTFNNFANTVINQRNGTIEARGGQVGFSCNTGGAQLDAVVNLSGDGHDDLIASGGVATATINILSSPGVLTSVDSDTFTINSPVEDETIDVNVDLGYGTQLLGGDYVIDAVLTITP